MMLSSAPLSAAPIVTEPAQVSAAQPNASISAPNPRDSELSRANEALLIENAELRQQVGKLEVQVRVLSEAQSTELFSRGVWLALLAVVIGFLAATFLIKRKSEW